MDDPAEIAALCQEYVSSLDNVPHEVTHILKEIQHKDTKVQDTIPKVATREAQLRELLNKGSPGVPVSAGGTAPSPAGAAAGSSSSSAAASPLTEQEKTKAEKLLERIKLDYRRMDEWSAHKEALSKRLWRILYAHHGRLSETFARIAPGVMNTAESNVAAAMHTAPGANLLVKRAGAGAPLLGQGGISILGAIASALGGGAGAAAAAAAGGRLPGLTDDGPSTPGATAAGLKRKAAAHLSLLGASGASGSASALSSRPSHSTPHSKLSSGGRAGSADGRGSTPSGASSSKAGAGADAALGGHTVETPTRGYHSPSATYARGGAGGVGRPRKSGAGTKGRYGSGSGGGGGSGLSQVLSAGTGGREGSAPRGGADDPRARAASSAGARSSSPSVGAVSSSAAAAAAAGLDGAASAAEDEKDENLYCFCQKVSYGEMIGCDAEDCPYEWFHLDCVGLREPLPQTWYCSECQVRMRLKDSSGTKEKEGKGEKGEKGEKEKGEKEVKKEGSVGASSTNSGGGGGGGGAGANKRRKKG